MSDQWKFSKPELNPAGFRELRRSPQAQAWVSRVGEAMAAAASRMSGERYDFRLAPGRNRARGVVAPGTLAAMRDSRTNLTLLKVLDAGRRA